MNKKSPGTVKVSAVTHVTYGFTIPVVVLTLMNIYLLAAKIPSGSVQDAIVLTLIRSHITVLNFHAITLIHLWHTQKTAPLLTPSHQSLFHQSIQAARSRILNAVDHQTITIPDTVSVALGIPLQTTLLIAMTVLFSAYRKRATCVY